MRRGIVWSVSIFFGLSCTLMVLFIFTQELGQVFWRMFPPGTAHYLAAWSPNMAAALLIGFMVGSRGLGAWVRGWAKWRVGFGWYLAALSPIAIAFLEIAIVALFGGKLEPSRWRFSSEFALTLVWLMVMGASGEEGGWRGFAQPLLQSRLPIPVASVLVGVMWALWHIPGYFVTGLLNTEIPFWRFAALIVANAVVMGWIVNGSGGSLLLASLYHFSLNASTLIAGCVLHTRVGTVCPSQEGLYLTYALIVGFAGFKKRGARQWLESYADTTGND